MKTEKATKAATAAHAAVSNKMAYMPPQVEVIKMELEGVIAGSPGSSLDDITGGGNLTNQTSVRRSYNSASGSDLEDLINDILTVEQ